MPIRTLLLVFLAVAALSGCGRKGYLEAPPPTPIVAKPLDELEKTQVQPTPQAVPSAPQPTTGPRRFLLDFLL